MQEAEELRAEAAEVLQSNESKAAGMAAAQAAVSTLLSHHRSPCFFCPWEATVAHAA